MGVNEHVSVSLGPTAAVAAGTGDVWYWQCNLPGKYKVISAKLMPHNAQTANDTNYSTYTAANVTQSRTMATRDYLVASGNSVAGTPETLSVTGLNAEVTQGDVLSWTKAETASGLAGHNTLELVLERQRL